MCLLIMQEYELSSSGEDCEVLQVVVGWQQIAIEHSSANGRFISVIDVRTGRKHSCRYSVHVLKLIDFYKPVQRNCFPVMVLCSHCE